MAGYPTSGWVTGAMLHDAQRQLDLLRRECFQSGAINVREHHRRYCDELSRSLRALGEMIHRNQATRSHLQSRLAFLRTRLWIEEFREGSDLPVFVLVVGVSVIALLLILSLSVVLGIGPFPAIAASITAAGIAFSATTAFFSLFPADILRREFDVKFAEDRSSPCCHPRSLNFKLEDQTMSDAEF